VRADVMRFHCDLEGNLCNIRECLLDGTWEPKAFRSFERVTEAKRRQIQAPVFADRIVHHAIVRVLEPLYEKKFIYDSYSCRKGKGTHAAATRMEQFARCAKAQWAKPYVLKCDVSKFFPSINHGILMEILAQTIREEKVLCLIEKASVAPENTSGKGLPIFFHFLKALTFADTGYGRRTACHASALCRRQRGVSSGFRANTLKEMRASMTCMLSWFRFLGICNTVEEEGALRAL